MDVQLKIFVGSMLLFVIGFIFSFLYVYLYSWKLSFYVKKNKYDRWRELSTIGPFGPGLANPFKGWRYIYGEVDNEDEIILRYKDKIKAGFRLSFFMAVAMFVNALMVFYLAT